MALLSGLLYSSNVTNILDLKYSKSYDAQHRNPSDRSVFGYKVIKLDEDVTFYVGWRLNAMKGYLAKKGEYLTQTIGQPPEVIKTWDELRSKNKVFQNTEKKPRAATRD